MLRPIAALLILAASTAATSPALSTGAWWEKITVTMTGDGKTQSCKYETSLREAAPDDCKVVGGDSFGGQSVGAQAQFSLITFERRFSPGTALPQDSMQLGDKLLGRQVMALAIDSGGKVSGCRIVARSGDLTPEYGCEEAAAEKFEAAAEKSAATARQGYMTILIYGHSEHLA